jgi:hypothetical protein
MAQSGYTPISLYYSSTTGAAPTAGQLVNGELGINITDGKLYYKDNISAIKSFTSGSGSAYDVQTFTSSGTWTKPAGVNNVQVFAIGGGGGGGSGRKGAVSTARVGGGGAGVGGYANTIFQASALTSTVTVTVGTGGTGGASQTTNSTNGNAGNLGGDSTFGTYLTGTGGNKGSAGTTASSFGVAITNINFPEILLFTRQLTSGMSYSNTIVSLSSGGFTSTSIGGTGGGIYGAYGPAEGAGGGSITTANAISNVLGYGGNGSTLINGGFAGGTASIVDGSTGGNGTAATANMPYGGGGGGSGQASLLTNAGAGGNGGLYGAGGAGGGASVDSLGNSGAGGNGADGIIVVISW